MKYNVYVTLKKSVLDPQGVAIKNALHHNDFTEVTGVRLGKYVEIELADGPVAEREERLRAMCDKLLANPVIETYKIEQVAE